MKILPSAIQVQANLSYILRKECVTCQICGQVLKTLHHLSHMRSWLDDVGGGGGIMFLPVLAPLPDTLYNHCFLRIALIKMTLKLSQSSVAKSSGQLAMERNWQNDVLVRSVWVQPQVWEWNTKINGTVTGEGRSTLPLFRLSQSKTSLDSGFQPDFDSSLHTFQTLPLKHCLNASPPHPTSSWGAGPGSSPLKKLPHQIIKDA